MVVRAGNLQQMSTRLWESSVKEVSRRGILANTMAGGGGLYGNDTSTRIKSCPGRSILHWPVLYIEFTGVDGYETVSACT